MDKDFLPEIKQTWKKFTWNDQKKDTKLLIRKKFDPFPTKPSFKIANVQLLLQLCTTAGAAITWCSIWRDQVPKARNTTVAHHKYKNIGGIVGSYKSKKCAAAVVALVTSCHTELNLLTPHCSQLSIVILQCERTTTIASQVDVT